MSIATSPGASPPALTLSAAAVLRDAKSAFLASHRDRCGYLKITFAPAEAYEALAISALFTLPGGREWHNADASIAVHDLRHAPEIAVSRAFAQLADGIATVGIAQRFRPRDTAPDPSPRRL
jgi:hypothetical protein